MYQHPIEKLIDLTCEITSDEYQTDVTPLIISCAVKWDGTGSQTYVDVLGYNFDGILYVYGHIKPLDAWVHRIANRELDEKVRERMTYEDPEFAPLRHRAFAERQAEIIEFRRGVL